MKKSLIFLLLICLIIVPLYGCSPSYDQDQMRAAWDKGYETGYYLGYEQGYNQARDYYYTLMQWYASQKDVNVHIIIERVEQDWDTSVPPASAAYIEPSVEATEGYLRWLEEQE